MMSSNTHSRRRQAIMEAAQAAEIRRAEQDAYVSARIWGRMSETEARAHARDVRILAALDREHQAILAGGRA